MNVDARTAISEDAAPSLVLETGRLVLRPLRGRDAPAIYGLANHPDVAATTTFVHPYSLSRAEELIVRHREEDARGVGAHFAIVVREVGELCGEVGLTIEPAHARAELGYWLGRAYWGRGYCTEAGRRILEYGFGTLGLHRVFASHFSGNDASGRVLAKLGMRYEGRLREHMRKGDGYVDLETYGLLRDEWARRLT